MDSLTRGALVVALVVSFSGCVVEDADPGTIQGEPGIDDRVGTTWFLLIEDSFEIQGDGAVSGDFGPHCEEAFYNDKSNPAGLTLYGGQGAPYMVVLRRYSEESLSSDRVHRDVSSGLVRHDAASGQEIELPSPFSSFVLARLEADVSGVRLDGLLLDDQQERSVSKTYEVDGSEGPNTVKETLRVRNLGRIDPEVRAVSGPCD